MFGESIVHLLVVRHDLDGLTAIEFFVPQNLWDRPDHRYRLLMMSKGTTRSDFSMTCGAENPEGKYVREALNPTRKITFCEKKEQKETKVSISLPRQTLSCTVVQYDQRLSNK